MSFVHRAEFHAADGIDLRTVVGDFHPAVAAREAEHHAVAARAFEEHRILRAFGPGAERAVQAFAEALQFGDALRGATWVALHNGGGVGWGEVINGGFGMVLDGSERVDEILRSAMPWDVMGGVARRSWARNENALETAAAYNGMGDENHITLPFLADEEKIHALVEEQYDKYVK